MTLAYLRDYAPGSVSGVKYAAISGTTGDITAVAAVTGKKIRVISAAFSLDVNGTVRFESGAGGTALTGVMPLLARAIHVLPENPSGWFETAAATLLNIELGTAGTITGFISYIEV